MAYGSAASAGETPLDRREARAGLLGGLVPASDWAPVWYRQAAILSRSALVYTRGSDLEDGGREQSGRCGVAVSAIAAMDRVRNVMGFSLIPGGTPGKETTRKPR